MSKLLAALATLAFFSAIDHALADSTAPSSAVVQEIFQRYSPRLQGLTPAKVESIWRDQAKREPWFQQTYVALERGKDDPGLVSKLKRELTCEDTSAAQRDQTYALALNQYRCALPLSVEGVNANIVLYLNVNSSGTLDSVVIYQSVPGMSVKKFVDAGLSQRDAMALTELHFEVLSRIDNARAPSGSFVEYGKTGDIQKFAVRFK